MENLNSAIVPPENMLYNEKVNAPLHFYSSAQEDKNQLINEMLKYLSSMLLVIEQQWNGC